ncbi:hypothetical protein D3OALGA1CA_3880 [Olavius algarvensis associated proteobacterium Delta 3]|nr:hypothetical protein D3OALGA1CA_3880 [Olavius algarvensis associated proteobacterium Delta 3]CAB5166985.1 hypothetical protein D3OALGB2SA_5830 [Olavius algarvensis associated proteobacterium Delta 3]
MRSEEEKMDPMTYGFSVATYNLRHFERIEGLKIEPLIALN